MNRPQARGNFTREKFQGLDDLYFLLGEMELEVNAANERAKEAEQRLQAELGRSQRGQSPRKTAELLARAVREADEARTEAQAAQEALKAQRQEQEEEHHSHRRTWEDASALRSRHNALKEQASKVA
eukprot:COSAG05_NODE_12428_length_468_cov_0.981030_1_plen_126_part_01